MPSEEIRPPVVVCALYKFTRLPAFADLREPLLAIMEQYQVRGTLLLAPEGINGTIAADRTGIDAVLTWLRQQDGLGEFDYKESYHSELPFNRSKVKLKKEIVTMGVEGIDPNRTVGTYVDPAEWNQLLADPEVLLIDTRNDYEYEIGTFKNALNPNTQSFREFPGYVKNNLDPAEHKKVAMFCTGGIRCEKSTAYLKEQGFAQVYHLRGGILNYLAQVPEEESLWQGECFVFDERVAVNHQLQKGKYDQCFACRYPITEADKRSEYYLKGVSCPRCYDRLTPEQRARFQEREKQVQLAKARGETHIGASAREITGQRRAGKYARRSAQRQASRATGIRGKQ